MKITHTTPSTVLGNPDDWDRHPFTLGGITIPEDAPTAIIANIVRLTEGTYELYSDKWLAVIREYLCNAKDIQRRISNERAIDVFFPTRLENQLRFRDYGTGLDLSGMTERFGCFGGSDKNETNDENGAFGIGCKCAFGITASFGVVSYQPNEAGVMTKTVWHITKDEGFGALYRLKTTFEVPDEEAGLEIIIPCSTDDWAGIQNRLQNFLRYFDHDVVVHNQPEDFEIKQPEYMAVAGTGWKLRKGGDNNHTRIINGGVMYNVNAHQILNMVDTDSPQLAQIQKMLDLANSLSLDIWVDIGGVDLARTREELDYNRRLTEVLTEVFKVILEEAYDCYEALASVPVEGDGIALREFIHTLRKNNKQFAALLGKDKLPDIKITSTSGATAINSTWSLAEYNISQLDTKPRPFSIWAPVEPQTYSRFDFKVTKVAWSRGRNSGKVKLESSDDTNCLINGDEIFVFNNTKKTKTNPLVWGVVGQDGFDRLNGNRNESMVVVEIRGDENRLVEMLEFYHIDASRVLMMGDFEPYNPYRRASTARSRVVENRPPPKYYRVSSDNLPTARYNKRQGYEFIDTETMWTRETTPVAELDIDEDSNRIAVKVCIATGKWDRATGEYKFTNQDECPNRHLRNLIRNLRKLTDREIDVYAFTNRDYKKVEMQTLRELVKEVYPTSMDRFKNKRGDIVRSITSSSEINTYGNNFGTDVAKALLQKEYDRVNRWVKRRLVTEFNQTSWLVAETMAALHTDPLTGEKLLGWDVATEAKTKAQTITRCWEKKINKTLARNPILRYVTGAPEELIRDLITTKKPNN